MGACVPPASQGNTQRQAAALSKQTQVLLNRLCNKISMIHVHIFILLLQITFFSPPAINLESLCQGTLCAVSHSDIC